MSRRITFWLLYWPPVIWLVLFFIVPVILMLLLSFRADLQGELLSLWSPTLSQYARVFAVGSFLRLLVVSMRVALVVATASVLLAFPLSYFLARYAGRRSGLYLIILLVPFWTSYLLRVMAWNFMLGQNGILNSFLQYVHLINEPLTILLYNRNAVILTLVYVWIPFAALPILAALQRIDGSLYEAAADLGARPFNQFMRITLPLSFPGILASFFMVFIPTVGEYVTPLLVGGSRGFMYGNIIQDFFTKAANWPLGSALSMIMLVGSLIIVGIALRLIDLRQFFE